MSANINGLLTRPPLHVKPWWCLKWEVDFNCIDNRKIDMGSIYMSRRRWYSSQIKDRLYAVPYRLHKIPKEEKVRLKWHWARPLNRNDLPKNVFVFSINFIDGRPSAWNPTFSSKKASLQFYWKLHCCRTIARKVGVFKLKVRSTPPPPNFYNGLFIFSRHILYQL